MHGSFKKKVKLVGDKGLKKYSSSTGVFFFQGELFRFVVSWCMQ